MPQRPIPEAQTDWLPRGRTGESPLIKALAAQAGASLLAAALAGAGPTVPANLLAWACAQGTIAAVLGRYLGLEPWWLGINARFVPGLVCTLEIELPARSGQRLYVWRW